VNKKDLKTLIRAGRGQLATEAKIEEYAKLMADKKAKPAAKKTPASRG